MENAGERIITYDIMKLDGLDPTFVLAVEMEGDVLMRRGFRDRRISSADRGKVVPIGRA